MNGASDSEEFGAILRSDGPHPDIPTGQLIFAPFIGRWDLDVAWLDQDGRIAREARGEWHFAWVLEGRAVQDVWIVPGRAERNGGPGQGEYGTSIRFFDADIGGWRSTWIGPSNRYLKRFIARQEGETVVLRTTDDETGPAMRWTFSDISANAFRWRNEISEEGGWRVQQRFEARRRE